MKRLYTRTKGLAWRVGLALCSSLIFATSALADTAGSSGSGEMNTLMLMFLVFLGVIIVIQLIPALVIFGCCIAAVCKRSRKVTDADTAKERV